MADMPTDFWGGWIAVITVVSLVGLAWFVFSVYFSPHVHEEQSPVWDETLSKGSNPAPMWWFWFILLTMVFSVAYLMLYPGLGSYRGALKWSQGGRLGESYALYDYEFGELRQQVLESTLATLQADDRVMKSAQGIFNRNCTACHGPEGKGQAKMFPNLTDDVWQWGGDPTQIEQSIRSGRQAVMPGWEAALSTEGIRQVVDYIQSISQARAEKKNHPGQVRYQQFCTACHGLDGTGNPALGAPTFTDDNWLYGGSQADLAQTITKGRLGIMPSFGDRLDDVQVRMLVAWLTRD